VIRTNYSDEDKSLVYKLRCSYPDERIMRRFEILWLHACGKFAPEIAIIVQQNGDTVRQVIKNFQKGGIALVTAIDSNHPKNDLEKHRTSIIEEFTQRPPVSAREAAARIEKLTGIKRSEQRVRVFMNNIGMKFRKVAAIPAKADLEAQEDFKKTFWSLKYRGQRPVSRCCCSWMRRTLCKRHSWVACGVLRGFSFAVRRVASDGTCLVPSMRSRVN
jgi:transposase